MDALGQAVEGAFGIGEGVGLDYASGVGSQTQSAYGQGADVAGNATAGLWTGDASAGGMLGAAFASLVGGQAGIANTKAAGVAGSATAGLGTGDPSSGARLGGAFASGVGSNSGTARIHGSTVASAAGGGLRSQNDNASTWGGHLVQNFASGIRGMIDWARGAANAVASAVAGILGHTVPKEGPLRNGGKGEKEWGEHTIQNYIDGVQAKIPELRTAMAEASGAVAEALVDTEASRVALNMSVDQMHIRDITNMAARVSAGSRSPESLATTSTSPITNYYTIEGIDVTGEPDIERAVKTVIDYFKRAKGVA